MITREEYGWLNIYRAEGFRWIIRDKNKWLYVYDTKPEKRECEWRTTKPNSNSDYIEEGYRLFPNVKWEDEEPTKIDDLIRDYESHKEIVGEKVKVTVPQYVADWIEEVKQYERSFKLELLFDTDEMPDEVFDWLDERYGDTDILAKAWLDGYEIEQEKLYTVDLNFNQALGKRNGVIKFYDPNDTSWIVERKLTKDEIESVNPILMQIAKEVE